MCFGCSKVPSHRDGSFEYPQHLFWLRNKKTNSYLGASACKYNINWNAASQMYTNGAGIENILISTMVKFKRDIYSPCMKVKNFENPEL